MQSQGRTDSQGKPILRFPPDDFLGIAKIVIDLFSGFGIVNELARASLWLGSSVGRAGD